MLKKFFQIFCIAITLVFVVSCSNSHVEEKKKSSDTVSITTLDDSVVSKKEFSISLNSDNKECVLLTKNQITKKKKKYKLVANFHLKDNSVVTLVYYIDNAFSSEKIPIDVQCSKIKNIEYTINENLDTPSTLVTG